MQAVGAFDAKNKFGTLLEWVEAGEDVVISRRGRPVARLVSYAAAPNPDQAQQALARISARAKARAMTLGPAVAFDWDGWKAMRDEGRR